MAVFSKLLRLSLLGLSGTDALLMPGGGCPFNCGAEVPEETEAEVEIPTEIVDEGDVSKTALSILVSVNIVNTD